LRPCVQILFAAPKAQVPTDIATI